jgi:hypothetical protein
MPGGEEVTLPVPVPVPARTTASENCGRSVKVAVQVLPLATIKVVLAVVPEHAPDQAENAEMAFGTAVSTIEEALLKLRVQGALQFSPAGFEMMLPPPAPANATETFAGAVGMANPSRPLTAAISDALMTPEEFTS